MKEINYKEMKFNPFNLIGGEWMLVTAGDNTVYFEEAKLVLICKKLYQSELQESGFLYQDTIDANYPQRDFHTMYVGKIEKVLVRDYEYLKEQTHKSEFSNMILNIINEEFSVCKVADYEGIDLSSPYIFIGSTDEEKSLVCPIQLVPDNTVERDDGWKAFRIEGILDFSR